MALFEPEETVGVWWHRLVGGVSTYGRHPEAAVRLEDMRRRLGVMYRALGGRGAIRVAASAPVASPHRLSLLQKAGLGTEKLELPILDDATLRLPGVIDVFPDRDDNEALYEWLAAFFASALPVAATAADPLQRDILRLRLAVAATRNALATWPGLRERWHRLRQATLAVRPERSLPPQEAELETAIRGLLGGERRGRQHLLQAIENPMIGVGGFHAPRGYRTYLPVPLWGEIMVQESAPERLDEAEDDGQSLRVDEKRHHAVRHDSDQSERGDPLLVHRFETIFSITEMVNLNRAVEDDDEDGARQAAEDMPEVTIGRNRRRASTRLKMDLDLAPSAADGEALAGGITYPEWDWKRGAYRKDHCRVFAPTAREEGEDWTPDEATTRRIRMVRRQFEALRPRRQVFHGQPDGDELDLSALVRDVAERRAGGAGTERVFTAARNAQRDLSVCVLMDVSLSTDAWLGGCRVLDVEKAALLALTHGLSACGDEHAIHTFTSRRRSSVTVSTVKGYEEPLGDRVTRRIEALKPGAYTRMGAAVRHVTKGLAERPHRHRLLLLLTDGKPNDVDYYEGRYGIEDTRMAIREARKADIRVFGVTVDEEARDYFPYIFGPGAYAIFPHAERLPQALPAIYRQLTA